MYVRAVFNASETIGSQEQKEFCFSSVSGSRERCWECKEEPAGGQGRLGAKAFPFLMQDWKK